MFEQGEEFSARGRISGSEEEEGPLGRRALGKDAGKTAWDQVVASSAGWAPASVLYELTARTFTIFVLDFLGRSLYKWDQWRPCLRLLSLDRRAFTTSAKGSNGLKQIRYT